MNAVISGQAGVALLLDGEELSSLHAGRLGEAIPRSTGEVPLLFGDAKDLRFLEETDVEEVSARLEQASNEVDALHLALLLLDESLSHDTRRTAAEELEELLESEEICRFVENILHAHPLPRGANLAGARAVCPGTANLTRYLLERLGSLQGVITEIYFAWEQIPEDLFGGKRDRTYAQSIAVREGFFRDLVTLREAEVSIDSFMMKTLLNESFRKVRNASEILTAWIASLRLDASAKSQIFETDFQARTVAELTERGSYLMVAAHGSPVLGEASDPNPLNLISTNDSKPNLLIVASARARTDSSSSLLRLVRDNLEVLRRYQIHTTDGTGQRLYGTGLFQSDEIKLHRAGKNGGIAQLAAMVARKGCEAAILLLDPSDPWADAVENRALKRVLIQLQVRLMTTYAAAQRWLTLEAVAKVKAHQPNRVQRWKPSNWVDGERNIVARIGAMAGSDPLEMSDPVDLPVGKRTIALISHDRMKLDMIQFVEPNSALLAQHQRILTTGTTGWLLKLLFASEPLELDLIRKLREGRDEERMKDLIVDILEKKFERIAKRSSLESLLEQLRKELKAITPNDAFVQKVMPLPSGPKGGDVLIAEAVLDNKCHSIIFFHDPETAHPHNDDIRLLEHTSQLPGVFCECVSDSASAEWWIRGLEAEVRSLAHGGRNLAHELRQAYGLHDVLLVNGAEDEDSHVLGSALASACAGYFNQRLLQILEDCDKEGRDEVRIGLGWGFGPGHVLSRLKEMKGEKLLEIGAHLGKKMLWSPLIGTLTPEITDREASKKAQDFCKFYEGEVDGFPCAGFARDENSIPDRAKALISKLAEADLILTSASPWDLETASSLYADTGVNPKYFPDPARAVGLMSGIVFDENGNEVLGDYVVVGLGLDGYRRAAERGAVILICGGRRRRPVVLALLRQRLVSTLVTTVKTAKWLLDQVNGEELVI